MELESVKNGTGFMIMMSIMIWAFLTAMHNKTIQFLEASNIPTLVGLGLGETSSTIKKMVSYILSCFNHIVPVYETCDK